MAIHKINPDAADDFLTRVTQQIEDDPKSPVNHCMTTLTDFVDRQRKPKVALDAKGKYYFVIPCYNMERQGLEIDRPVRVNTNKGYVAETLPPEPAGPVGSGPWA